MLKSTRVHRFLIVIAGIVVAAAPAVATSASFRHYVDSHPAVAAYLTIATPVLLAAYRELVAWRKKQA